MGRFDSEKLLMIVPSRNRADKAHSCALSFINSSSGNSDLMVCVDDDDPTLPNYKDMMGEFISERVYLAVGLGSKTMISVLNNAAINNADYYDFLGFAGDDHRFVTDNWDLAMTDSMRKNNAIVGYANDLYPHNDLPTSVVVDSILVRALGFLAPPELIHMYADNFWLDIGNELQSIEYFPDVVIEHMHYTVNKSNRDADYLRVEKFMQPDSVAYSSYKQNSFDDDVRKIAAYAGI